MSSDYINSFQPVSLVIKPSNKFVHSLPLGGKNFNYPAPAYGRSLIKPSYQAAGSGVLLLSIFYLNKHLGNVLKIITVTLPLLTIGISKWSPLH